MHRSVYYCCWAPHLCVSYTISQVASLYASIFLDVYVYHCLICITWKVVNKPRIPGRAVIVYIDVDGIWYNLDEGANMWWNYEVIIGWAIKHFDNAESFHGLCYAYIFFYLWTYLFVFFLLMFMSSFTSCGAGISSRRRVTAQLLI